MTTPSPQLIVDLMRTSESARTIMALDGALHGIRRGLPSDLLWMEVDELAALGTWIDASSTLLHEVLALRVAGESSRPSSEEQSPSTEPHPETLHQPV